MDIKKLDQNKNPKNTYIKTTKKVLFSSSSSLYKKDFQNKSAHKMSLPICGSDNAKTRAISKSQ